MSELLAMFDAARNGRSAALALDFATNASVRHVLSFAEVHARGARMRRALTARGLRPGDRLVVHLPNRVEYVDLLLACLRTGIILVPANVLYRGRELSHIVADADPALVITSPEHVALFGGDARVVTIDALAAEAKSASGTDGPSAPPVAPDAPALIIYTSGTTGRAKGAVLSHANLAANVRHLVQAWRITSDDRLLCVLPLFHVHGLCNGVCSWLATGGTMRLEERFDHTKAPDWFVEFRPTLFFGVPTIYTRMLEWPPAVHIGRSVRLFVSGSAPLPAHVHAAFRARFGQAILERYGMSETLMNVGNPYDGERRAGTVGVPFAGVHVRIVTADGTPVPDGTVGEVEVRGPNVFAGYWRNDEATARAFRDGWFRTGDMGERSADGYVTLRGRAGDVIISGGFNIYPREIEDVLLEVPGVREAVVAGTADDRRGELPVAYIVADDATTDDHLRAACTAAIASFKVPRAFVRMDTLPRTALGKVQKHLLPPISLRAT